MHPQATQSPELWEYEELTVMVSVWEGLRSVLWLRPQLEAQTREFVTSQGVFSTPRMLLLKARVGFLGFK